MSTGKEATENQLRELRQVAAGKGWEVVQEFVDAGVSGAIGPKDRPKLAAMPKAATRGEFDVVAAWSVGRLGRSVPSAPGAAGV